jgi:hypothetical protein
LGGGRRLRPAIGDIDGRKIEMPAFHRRHEAALATQSQVWIESLSLTTERRAKPSSARSGSSPTTMPCSSATT